MRIGEIIRDFKSYYRQLKRQRNVVSLQGRDARQLFKDVCRESKPCFVLSTGRCGTKMLTHVLSANPSFDVKHQPAPEMLLMSKYAYNHYKDKDETLQMAFIAARYEMIRDSFLNDLQYVETNNRITFFAYQIVELFPSARFIHLIRHPHAFISSGMSRGWYLGSHLHDEGRITPQDIYSEWENYSRVQKIACLWNETNAFIDAFKQQYGARVLTMKSEDFFSDPQRVNEIIDFIGADRMNEKYIEKLLSKPQNTNKKKYILSGDEKKQVDQLTPISKKYYP